MNPSSSKADRADKWCAKMNAKGVTITPVLLDYIKRHDIDYESKTIPQLKGMEVRALDEKAGITEEMSDRIYEKWLKNWCDSTKKGKAKAPESCRYSDMCPWLKMK